MSDTKAAYQTFFNSLESLGARLWPAAGRIRSRDWCRGGQPSSLASVDGYRIICILAKTDKVLANLEDLCYTSAVSEGQEERHELMTVQEVATRLRVSPATVYVWLKAGLLPACKIGGTWRVHRRELDTIIQGSSTTSSVS